MAQCPVRSCEICENFRGSRYCTECKQFFCKVCEISHLKSKSCRNHFFKDADIANPDVKTPICKQHGEKFTYYCNTCASLTCNICLPTTHNTHDFCLIDTAASKARSHLDKDMLAAEDRIRRNKENITSSKMTLKIHENEADKAKKDIVEIVTVIVNALNDTKDAYLKSIDDHILKESENLKKEILKIENATENGQEVLNKMKSSIAGENNVILLNSFSDKTKALESVSRVNTDTPIPARIQFHPVSTRPEAEKLIGNINFIKPNTIIKEADPADSIKSTTAIKVGGRVRVKPSIICPELGWGDVSHQSIGKVISIQEFNVTIKFPEHAKWEGYLSEVEMA